MPSCHFENSQYLPTKMQITFLTHTLIFFGFFVRSNYAGTSNLYAAYLAGACISWCDNQVYWLAFAKRVAPCLTDNETGDSLPKRADQIVFATQVKQFNKCFEKARSVPESSNQPHSASLRCSDTDRIKSVGEQNSYERQSNPNNSVTGSEINIATNHIYIGHISGLQIWETYYEASLSTVLKPFFFASIGFSIPVSKMLDGNIIWRGVVYAVLMTVGKFICGAWLIKKACFKHFGNDVESG